jgi:hypothetical protein
MTGGEPLGADLTGHAQKRFEFHVRVAICACNRSTAGEILVDERTDNTLLELFLKVDHIVRKVQVLRHALGVVYVVEGAAAVLRGTITLQFRETALIPELHGQADDGTALLQEKNSHGGGIDAPGHSDGDEAWL